MCITVATKVPLLDVIMSQQHVRRAGKPKYPCLAREVYPAEHAASLRPFLHEYLSAAFLQQTKTPKNHRDVLKARLDVVVQHLNNGYQ